MKKEFDISKLVRVDRQRAYNNPEKRRLFEGRERVVEKLVDRLMDRGYLPHREAYEIAGFSEEDCHVHRDDWGGRHIDRPVLRLFKQRRPPSAYWDRHKRGWYWPGHPSRP